MCRMLSDPLEWIFLQIDKEIQYKSINIGWHNDVIEIHANGKPQMSCAQVHNDCVTHNSVNLNIVQCSVTLWFSVHIAEVNRKGKIQW